MKKTVTTLVLVALLLVAMFAFSGPAFAGGRADHGSCDFPGNHASCDNGKNGKDGKNGKNGGGGTSTNDCTAVGYGLIVVNGVLQCVAVDVGDVDVL